MGSGDWLFGFQRYVRQALNAALFVGFVTLAVVVVPLRARTTVAYAQVASATFAVQSEADAASTTTLRTSNSRVVPTARAQSPAVIEIPSASGVNADTSGNVSDGDTGSDATSMRRAAHGEVDRGAQVATSAPSTAPVTEPRGTTEGSTTATSAATPEPTSTIPAPSIGITYLNRPVFFIADDGSKAAKERAKRLTEALKTAIEAPDKSTPEAPNVELEKHSTGVELHVRGYAVGTLTPQDALAAGHGDFDIYAKSLDEGLDLFIADQRRRIALQGFAVRVAITLLVSIGGLFLLRLAQALFRRADDYLDEHSSSLRPVRVLGVPVLGVEALGAALTFALAIGRIVALASITALTVAIGLAQFDTTRPWIAVIVEWSSERVFHAIEELVLMLPRLLLAALLLLIGSAAVRVARVLFDDSTTTATPWGTVSRRRAKVLKFLIPIGVFVLVVPLAVGAVFGRFHTPIELLIVALVLGGSLGLAPLVASGGMGLAATWHGTIQLGDYITVAGKSGRVSGVNPFWVSLETPSGELCSVPLLALVNTPVVHRVNTTFERIELRLARPNDIPALLENLRILATDVSEKVSVECLHFDAETVGVAIDVSAEPLHVARLVNHLAKPELDPPVLELTRKPYPDMVRGPN